jgi:hypothetical protein
MIDREELRELMEIEGHDPETVDKVLAWYYETPVGPDVLVEVLELLRQSMAEAVQSITEAWEQLTGAGVGQPLQKKEKPRRPARCIGPKNKAATRVPRPARVARSSCRKIHR